MPACRGCQENFPNRATIGGKTFSLRSRKFCLSCSPFKKIRTRKERKLTPKTWICFNCKKERTEKTRNIVCGTCRSQIRRAKSRSQAIDIMGGNCARCGYDKCYDALDFHHIGEKLFALAANWHRSWKSIEEEIKKCELLCANCHREEHAQTIFNNNR